jgi:hypothetical protein
MYGILQLQEIFYLWKKIKGKREEQFAVSFKSKDKSKPLIFNGIFCLRKYLGQAIFSKQEIAYLHSLQKKSGKLLFEEQFIHFLSSLTFDVKIVAPLEGEIFFPGQPIIKVLGDQIVLVFFKKVIEHYLPRQIYLTTEVEKIISTTSSLDFIIENNFSTYNKDSNIDVRCGYIAGAVATEDLSSALHFNIPICFHENREKIKFLNVQDKNFLKNLSETNEGQSIFLKGKISKEFIEEFPFLGKKLKGVVLDLSNFNENFVEPVFHYYRNTEVLDTDFKIFRYSYNGLYIGDIIGGQEQIVRKKMVFGKYLPHLKRKQILHDICFSQEESVETIKARVVENKRLLPCKYKSYENPVSYPIKILKKYSQRKQESLSNTKFA